MLSWVPTPEATFLKMTSIWTSAPLVIYNNNMERWNNNTNNNVRTCIYCLGVPSNLEIIHIAPPAYYCNNGYQCPVNFGYSRCENHVCVCDENFYEEYNNTSKKTYCRLCSRKSIFRKSLHIMRHPV